MMMDDKYIYGTLKECVDEFWNRIDFRTVYFPDVNIAVSVIENAKSIEEAKNSAEGWFGCIDVAGCFNCDTISLVFAHWGGGGVTAMELTGEYESEKQIFMNRLGESTENVGYGVLDPNDYVLFEIQ